MSRRYLFRLFAAAAPAGDHVADRELLRRFVSNADPAAFELLVRRHADAVWTAALRILGNETDAEDVFQAAFLALLRKAGSVRETCVGGWLHRVAVNAALKAKARRAPIVREGVNLPEPLAPTADNEQLERAAIIHQELARLPERYRLPVVLCDLEGQTHAEAATALGWPVGSVSGRLSRARDLLRHRLARRGLGVPAVLVASVTAPTTAVNAAAVLAAGTTAVSPVVSSLAEGVLSAMRIANLKLTAAVVAASGLVALAGVGTGYALTRTGPLMVISASPELPVKVAAADEPKPEKWTPVGPPPDPNDREPRPDLRVPTAFPNLKPPDRKKTDAEYKTPKEYREELTKACPRILDEDPPAVVPADDMYRRLLKARLHQGRLYLQVMVDVINKGNWNPVYFPETLLCLRDMQAAALELWANDPKVLLPWLEEFVILGKHFEDFVFIRVEAGIDPPQNPYAAQRHRLEAEAALWNAKNPQKAGGK